MFAVCHMCDASPQRRVFIGGEGTTITHLDDENNEMSKIS